MEEELRGNVKEGMRREEKEEGCSGEFIGFDVYKLYVISV